MKIVKGFVLIVIALLVFKYILNLYYQNNHNEWISNLRKEEMKLKENSRNFNIDSLTDILKKDSTFNITDCLFSKNDSTFFVCMEPKFNPTEKEYSDFCNKYNLNYALNVALVYLIKPFPPDSSKSKTFVPDILYAYARYGSSHYSEISKLKPQ